MLCSFKGCIKAAHSRGLCGAHYQQQRQGKELKPLQLQNHGLTEVERFMRWISKLPDGCWRWMGSIKLRKDRPQKEWHGQWRSASGKIELTNRAAWRLFVGPIPPRAHVLHKCDVPRCCNPEHLFLGTQADNAADMWSKGRARPGTSIGINHGLAKATEELVRQIRASDQSVLEISRETGLSRATVHSIRARDTWKHIL